MTPSPDNFRRAADRLDAYRRKAAAIAGHWVYLMLETSQWFLRDYREWQELRLKLPAPIAVEPGGK